MKTCNSFTDGLSQLKDEQSSTHFKVIFQDRYEKNRNLAEKRKYEDKRKERGSFGREILNNIKKQKMSTQVERLCGSKMSLRAWDIERKRESFETVEQAIERTSAEKVKVDSGIKKPKDHVGKISSNNIDMPIWKRKFLLGQKMILLYGIELGKSMSGIRKIIYQRILGRLFRNISQRETEGFVYTFKGKGLPRKQHPRKCLLRVYNDQTMPVDSHECFWTAYGHENILSGEIDIGVLSGTIETSKFSVYGRKHPLANIRRNLLKKHYKHMRRNSDAYFKNIDIATLTERLATLNELNCDDSINTMRLKLKNFERTRNIIM